MVETATVPACDDKISGGLLAPLVTEQVFAAAVQFFDFKVWMSGFAPLLWLKHARLHVSKIKLSSGQTMYWSTFCQIPIFRKLFTTHLWVSWTPAKALFLANHMKDCQSKRDLYQYVEEKM